MTTRREFMKTTAILGGIPAMSSLVWTGRVFAEDPSKENEAPVEQYELPPLPYRAEGLEPYIDGRTMTIHHAKHMHGYINGLNATLKELRKMRESGDFDRIQSLSRALSFHAGGYVNHVIFFNNMAPVNQGGGGVPKGELAKGIDREFGSFESFKKHFSAAAAKVEGNGWGVLSYHPVLKRLVVTQMMNQQDLNTIGLRPLLMLDVWEHAYYLQYQNKRSEYIENWWNIINWADVSKRYHEAIQ